MSRYEENVIRPILNIVEKHQDLLCKPENLPQLAKLGFMFEKLWYAGRVAYGYEGIVNPEDGTCENNPKYELEDHIEYNSEENENLIYDAWGMHVSNDPNTMNFETYKNLILNGRELSEFEKRSRKPNKTFDDWVEVMTNEEYRYKSMFPDRRSVANYLLCTYGNAYGYNKSTGMVIKEASGADQDEDGYGDWENAKFISEIQEVVDAVLAFDMTKIAMDAESAYVIELLRKEEEKKWEESKHLNELLLKSVNDILSKAGKPTMTIDSKEFKDFVVRYEEKQLNRILGEHNINKEGKFEYFPFCNYSIITMLDENSHVSYLKAGLEICEDIMANPPQNKPNYNDFQKGETAYMIKFAQDFVKRFSYVKDLQ